KAGPAKQNRAMRLTSPSPVMASRFRANADSAGRQVPRCARFWPALGGPAPASPAPPSASRSVPLVPASSAAIADPGVEDSVGNVGRQVADHRGDADDEGGAEQHREVVGGGGLVKEQPHPRVVEDLLGD